jgi:hypothetical protein
MPRLIILLVITCCTIPVFSQELMQTNPDAVKTIDGIVNEMLHIVSGEEGKKRDWDAFRRLFLSTARFTVRYQDSTFNMPIETVSIDEFIEYMGDEYYDEGFIEYELGKSVDEYNGIANVFQSYYVRDGDGDSEMGINSYQLIYFSERWWIANLVWTGDRNGQPIPRKYLNDK